MEHFDDYFTFNDAVAGACHAGVCLHHMLSDRKAVTLRNSGVSIIVQVHMPAVPFPSQLVGMLDLKAVHRLHAICCERAVVHYNIT